MFKNLQANNISNTTVGTLLNRLRFEQGTYILNGKAWFLFCVFQNKS